jgi:hypothetical protein
VTWTFHLWIFWERNQHKLFQPCFFCSHFLQKYHLLATFRIKFILFSSIKIIHPWTLGRIFLHVNKDCVLHVTKYFLNVLFTWTKYFLKDSVLFMHSCLLAHVHAHMLVDYHPSIKKCLGLHCHKLITFDNDWY